MAFLKDHDILTIRPDMDPGLRAHLGTLLARPARVLRRGRRARSGSDAHARLSLVRQGLDGERRPPEPGAQGGAALQHLQHAHRGLRDGVRGADASGRHVRRAAALARAGLHPGRRTRRTGAGRPPHAQPRVHARTGLAVCVRPHAARLAQHERQPRPQRAASLPAAAGLRHELSDRQDRDRQAHHRAPAPARRRVHDEALHGRVQRGGPCADLARSAGSSPARCPTT